MRSDIYTLKDENLLAAHLILVSEIGESKVKFCSYGGGWVRTLDSETFFDRYRKAEPEELKSIMWYPAKFDIDGAYGDRPAIGYSNGLRWNGFAQPAFEKAGIERIREIFKAGPSEITFNETRDVVLVDMGDGVDEECRYEEFEGFDIIVQGGEAKHVYGVGAGFWVWDEIQPDEDND